MADLEEKKGGEMRGVSAKAEQEAPVPAPVPTAEPKIIAEHTLTETETLSHLSLKYYGDATRPYWMVIYEANKEAIGPNPALVRVGMKIKIPELPAELKK